MKNRVNNEGYFVLVEALSSKIKKYYFTTDQSVSIGDKVVIETIVGLELGIVCSSPIKESEMKDLSTFDQIQRKCTDEDLLCYEKNKKEINNAKKIFNQGVERLKLPMTLVSCCSNIDKTKILFTYVAEERVDFRELLKELSSNLKCRIELRQIGSRDRSKIIGGLGMCGLPLCCASFLKEFDGISINMAKNQFLSLNIQKLSGPCGKLLCCLKYENEYYSKLKEKFPKVGRKIKYEGNIYKVISINVLSGTVRLESEDRETVLNVDVKAVKGNETKNVQ